MKKFYILANSEKAKALETAEKLKSIFAELQLETGFGICGQYDHDGWELPEGTDILITIGGDGTLLYGAHRASVQETAILGINRGHIGYLTELSGTEDLKAAVKRILEDDYKIEERMMLQLEVSDKKAQRYEESALNEVLITHEDPTHVLKFDVLINDRMLGTYCADGIVAATPTGSSAYSLSAGGPLAKPDSEMIILTPICPVGTGPRSIILAPEDRVRIVPKRGRLLVSCDSFGPVRPGRDADIRIFRSRRKVKFVKLQDMSFLDVLRSKMNYI